MSEDELRMVMARLRAGCLGSHGYDRVYVECLRGAGPRLDRDLEVVLAGLERHLTEVRRLREALTLAEELVEQYQSDVRQLGKPGFCRGSYYRDACAKLAQAYQAATGEGRDYLLIDFADEPSPLT